MGECGYYLGTIGLNQCFPNGDSANKMWLPRTFLCIFFIISPLEIKVNARYAFIATAKLLFCDIIKNGISPQKQVNG